MEEIPEGMRNDTHHRILVAEIAWRRIVIYEGYSPLQCAIMESWCKDQGFNYRVILSDDAFENLK